MRILLLFGWIIIGLFLSRCSEGTSPKGDPPENQIRDLTNNEQQVVQSTNTFGLKLFREIASYEEASKDIFISPPSVSMALGMTLNGANGSTYEAIRNTLQLAGLSNEEINKTFRSLIDLLIAMDEKVLFEIANSIWYRNTFSVEPLFLQTNQTYFDAEITALDFTNLASVDIINNWVANKTHDKIKEIIDSIEPSTVMFLINAIYFKGIWTYEFDKDLTQDDLFFLTSGSMSTIKMMKIAGEFGHYKDDNVQIIDLPYGDKQFSMTILLPAPEQNIADFIATLDDPQMDYYFNHLTSDSGTLQLPKFKLEYELKMNDVLSALGMGVAFSPSGANFSRINPDVPLFISKVKHKTFVQVDEEGTEAAAVTIVEVNLTSIEPNTKFHMRVDRPFVFLIREKHSKSILFMGKIMQPQWTD